MTQTHAAWGADPSPRYDDLASRFRPVIERIRATAAERDLKRELPHDELRWLRESGFTRLRLPREQGGFDATLPELFNLLIELGAADTNVVNAIRAQLSFTEDVLNSPHPAWRERWLTRLANNQLIGSGFSEVGDAKAATFSTRVTRTPAGLRLNGTKFYTTGSLFADWIHVGASNDDGESILVTVPTRSPGVRIDDDWDGFGQSLTASGTATFTDVVIEPEWLNPGPERYAYSAGFLQLIHLASLAGIGRALAEDVAHRVRERDRTYSHGNAARVADDPQILQVVGRVRSAAYGAGTIVVQGAAALQRVAYILLAGDDATQANAAANIEVSQGVSVVTDLILRASTELFDALGASATRRDQSLDRYWRNARTISSHNPRIYRDRQVGAFAVNAEAPPTFYRVGTA